MRNQPKYQFFKNLSYAVKGFKDIIKTETSFKIELIISMIILPPLLFIDIDFIYKIFMFMSYMCVIVAEVINSAIERCVDLVTTEFNEMAGKAKDVGSLIVLISIIQCLIIWFSIIIKLIIF